MISKDLAVVLQQLCDDRVDGLHVTREANIAEGSIEYYLYYWLDDESTACWKFRVKFTKDHEVSFVCKHPEASMTDPFEPFDFSLEGYFAGLEEFKGDDLKAQAKAILRDLVHYVENVSETPPTLSSGSSIETEIESEFDDDLMEKVVRVLNAVVPFTSFGDVLDDVAPVNNAPENSLQLGGKRLPKYELKQNQKDFLAFLQSHQWVKKFNGPKDFVSYHILLDNIKDIDEFSEVIQDYFKEKFPESKVAEIIEDRIGYI